MTRDDIARWVQQRDEELLYAPDAATPELSSYRRYVSFTVVDADGQEIPILSLDWEMPVWRSGHDRFFSTFLDHSLTHERQAALVSFFQAHRETVFAVGDLPAVLLHGLGIPETMYARRVMFGGGGMLSLQDVVTDIAALPVNVTMTEVPEGWERAT